MRHSPVAVGGALGLALLALSSSAPARPLDLQELHEMEQYLECAYTTCRDACEAVRQSPGEASLQEHVGCETCLSDEGCGHAPRLWEKNGVPPVDMADHELAVLEQLYPDAVCYADEDENIVRPPGLCPGELCEARLGACLDTPEESTCEPIEAPVECEEEDFGETCWYAETPQQPCPGFVCQRPPDALEQLDVASLCSDGDGDGVPAWAEDRLAGATVGASGGGQSCTPGQGDCTGERVCARGEQDRFVCQRVLCNAEEPCGFFQVCRREPGDVLATCQPRAQCTPRGAPSGGGGGGPSADAGGADASSPDGAAAGEPNVCDPGAGACVDCLHNGHCGAGERCAEGDCVSAGTCDSSLDCGDGEVCDPASGFCVGCLSDAECADGETCTSAQRCQPVCQSDLDCTPQGEVCSVPSGASEAGHCVACRTDAPCDFDETCVRGSCRPTRCADGTQCQAAPGAGGGDDGDDDGDGGDGAQCPDLDCHAASTGGSGCNAFHLEKVAADDTQAIVHVHYDHTPVPARVLDLYLNYDETQLQLQDARRLEPLELRGKELASQHTSDGKLVLSVFDDDASHPIPTGPIVELVFRRTGPCATEIGFTERPELRTSSVAPMQGSEAVQQQLADDALWGEPVVLCPRDEVSPELRLWYDFEQTDEPLGLSTVPSAEELCARVPGCANEKDEEAKQRFRTRLADLQSGDLVGDESVPGVTRDGVYLDGTSDHLRMPVHYEDQPLSSEAQSFSMSTWFYTEGNSDNELATTPQLLYSHNAYDERTAFGLMSVETGDGKARLALFHGDVLDPRLDGETVLDEAQPLDADPEEGCATVEDPVDDAPAFWVNDAVDLRTWHHVAFTLNADYDGGDASDDARLELYWDGKYAGCVEVPQPPAAVKCPQFAGGTDVKLHDEGDVLGGESPEYVYTAVRRSGLFGIERMDPHGLQSEVVVGDEQHSYKDPDYHPGLDKLVYSADVSGDREIWIADGDGSDRKRLTEGFGDADRGITARRPRWAPDGSAIVFDSNVFDVQAQDNTFARVRHVYYLGYDPEENEVAIRLADGSTTDQLAYDARVADQTISDYRLTSAMDRHQMKARWLTGERPDQPQRAKGTLLVDTAGPDYSNHRVQRLTIPEALPLASTASVSGLGQADDIRLLDAHHSEKAGFPMPTITERALIQREDRVWEPNDQFVVECADGEPCGPDSDQSEMTVVHDPSGYDDQCWDRNFNGVKDADEDRNGDGVWDVKDCYPAKVDVYVSYDDQRFEPVTDLLGRCTADRDCDGGRVCVDERCELAGSAKQSCDGQDDCPQDTLCLDGTCRALVGTVLGCTSDADCFAGNVCDEGECKVPGSEPRSCVEDTGCTGAWICSGGRCVHPDGSPSCGPNAGGATCGAGRVCSAGTCVLAGPKSCQGEADCAPGQRCEGGECKVLGRIGESGATKLAGCVQDVDCDGGQRCINGQCVAISGAIPCSTDGACPGGSVCVSGAGPSGGGLCREAAGAALQATPGADCDLDADCDGGQVCEPGSGTCQAASGPRIWSEPGTAVTEIFGKELELDTRFADVGGQNTALLRLQLRTPQSGEPIPDGATLARIRLREQGTAAGQHTPEIFEVRKQVELAVKDLTSTGLPELIEPAGKFQRVEQGAFSPDGDQLMLSAINRARPTLLRTETITSALDADRINVTPRSVSGLSWVRQARFYPCNWAGGYLHLQSKDIRYGFRGGLDDLKIHEGLRDPMAIRSEAQRGFEFLAQEDRTGQVDSKLPDCSNSHAECPPFQLCVDSECQMIPCDPEDPWSCSDVGGRCTLRPESVEQEHANASGSGGQWDWVCAADCTTDSQCFQQSCANGPCRFCDSGTQTCIECRNTVKKVGNLEISTIEGCPDRSSFACESGTCVTDCYAFEDGESIYQCNPATEFCEQGECVLRDWSWWDLSPMTFSGLGQMRREVPPAPDQGWNGYTQAVDQRVPVQVVAYGQEDWTHSPEMIVEVRGGPFYGSDWHRIGQVRVHHRTRVDAQQDPYELSAPHVFDDIRMRLVTPPYDNVTGAATGLRATDGPFCIARVLANVPGATDEDAVAACTRTAQGSRYTAGHPVGIPDHVAIEACRAAGHAGCPTVSQDEHAFLQPGQPAVAVTKVRVDGAGVMNNVTSNKVCSYGGDLQPVDDEGEPAKITYGPFDEERSNQADALRERCAPSEVPSDFTGLWTGDGSAEVSSGDGSGPGDGVAHDLDFVDGKVGEAFAFDEVADYLSVPAEVVEGGEGFSVEGWVRTGDVAGGLLTLFARPSSCAAWKERGRTDNGRYTVWPDGRPLRVHCDGMADPDAEARAYVDLKRTDVEATATDDVDAPGANVSRYRPGGGSFGTPVRTSYEKLRFDPETMTVDIGDQRFAESNGGLIGHDCGRPAETSEGPPSAADPATRGCYRAQGGLRHLWRGEYDVADAVTGHEGPLHGVGFTTGRIGQAMTFGPEGARVRSAEGLPEGTRAIGVDAWIRTTHPDEMVVARQGNRLGLGSWELAVEEGRLRFTVHGGEDTDDAGAEIVSPDGSAGLADGTWHHVAATMNAAAPESTRVELFVDGALVATTDSDTLDPESGRWSVPPVTAESPIVAAPVVLGQGRHGARAFRGAMDDVGVWAKRLPEAAIEDVYGLGAWRFDEAGAGYGKCLPEEVAGLDHCESGDEATTLPFGVAYACGGGSADAAAEATIDLRGTPYAVGGDPAEAFAAVGSNPHRSVEVRHDGQVVELRGGGGCGGLAPKGWSGDPTVAEPPSTFALELEPRDEGAPTPKSCEGDCLSRTADEVLAVDLETNGLEVRMGDRVYEAAHPEEGLHDFGWHHVAVVRAPDRVAVHVDGEPWLSTSDVPFLDDSALEGLDRVVVGQGTACAFAPEACDERTRSFEGELDELAFYDRALSDGEIDTVVEAGTSGRPVEGRPEPSCPSPNAGLVEFDRQQHGYALLNCNYHDPTPSGDSAQITMQNIVIQRQWPARDGAVVLDDGDTCLVEETPEVTRPCYAWLGSDVTVDPNNGLIPFGSHVPYQSLEVSLPRGFGHDMGFEAVPQTTHDLHLAVSGLTGGSEVEVAWSTSPTTGPVPTGNGTVDLADLRVGESFQVRVDEQPTGFRCGFLEPKDAEASCGSCVSGNMKGSDRTLQLDCKPVHDVAATVSFADEHGESVADPTLPSDLVLRSAVLADDALLGAQQLHVGPDGVAAEDGVSVAFDDLDAVQGRTVQLEILDAPAGWSCSASTGEASGPSGAVVDGIAEDVTFEVACQEVSAFPMEVAVSGLAGGEPPITCEGEDPNGLELEATVEGETTTRCTTSNGVASFDGLTLPAARSWELAVADQASGRSCELTEGATGTMPEGGLTASSRPQVACAQPDNVISGQVLGMTGPVELRLVTVGTGAGGADQVVATRTLEAPDYNVTPAPVPFGFDQHPLAEDVTFRVEVVEPPEGSSCEVTPKEYTTPLPSDDVSLPGGGGLGGGGGIVVNCEQAKTPTYTVGGTISGLDAPELRLGLKEGGSKIDVAPDATSFEFDLQLPEGESYDVSVQRHPEGQVCEVTANAEGVLKGDVEDVHVSCKNLATVRVTVASPFPNARVRAFLVKTGADARLAQRIGVEEPGPKVGQDGSVTFELAGDPPEAGPQANQDASPGAGAGETTFPPFEAGSYELHVLVSNVKNEANDEIYYPPFASRGTVVPVELSAPLPKQVDVTAQGLSLAPPGVVTFDGDGGELSDLPKDTEIICAWSPSGAADAASPPFDDDLAPIVGYSRWECGSSDGCSFWEGGSTDVHDGLAPGGSMRVTCWADADDDDTDKGELSIGDYWGRSSSVGVNAGLPIQTTVDFETFP